MKTQKELAKSSYWDTAPYFEKLESDVRKEYKLANLARKKGLDAVDEVEIPLARSMAEKSVGLISTIYPDIPVEKITERMLELEKKYGQLDTCVSFIIAKEIAEGKFYEFEDKLKAIDCGIRVGFAYITLGVVASPIEGYTGFEVKKRKDGKEYWCAYFSGPIRSAGTTATCVVLMLIDFLREHFGYGKYDPSEDEVKRYLTENTDYHERVTNLQYFPTEEEMEFLAKNLPIEIGGDPTEKREVSNYKDLARVPTNFIRGGMCLTFSEGLAQKAKKGIGRLKSVKADGMKATGFDFLPEYLEIHDKREAGGADTVATYIKDLVAGRPVYGHPSRSGGFRMRYGRSRTAGFSATSIHPATMGISNGFLSQGTQLKIQKPTKGCIITSCDSIEGPIVKLNDGSVKKVKTFDEAKELYPLVEEIVYLGDMLFPLGDVIDRNATLVKPGYVEEWWDLELREKLKITGETLVYDKDNLSFEKAVEFSEKYSLPLHPSYIFYWTQLTAKDFFWLIDWLKNGIWSGSENPKLILPWSKLVKEKFSEGKRALELLGVEHKVVFDNVVIEEFEARALLLNLGISSLKEGDKLKELFEDLNEEDDFEVLNKVNSYSKFEIKDKAGEFIGTRMGRPEKAKLRKLTGSPNGLFPIAEQGGRLRSVNTAVEKGFIQYDWPIFRCECGHETIYPFCEKCKKKTKKMFYCRDCCQILDEPCETHERTSSYKSRKIDSKAYFLDALETLGMKKWEVAPLVKGVRGMSNDGKDFEHLAKALLRAKFNLQVNKDGTIRYDGTEVPLTHFKPFEIGTAVEKLRGLGYLKDIYGEELTDEKQILELKPHDILIPACPVTQEEPGDEVFVNIAKFVDEELEKFYKLPKYYNVKTREDLIGQLVACMAPHNCAGVIGRIIGFTKIQGLTTSPYMHAAMRRDCVYPSTKFIYSDEGIVKNSSIGKFVEKLIKQGNNKYVVDSYGTEKIELGKSEKELYAFGVNPKTKKLVKKKIKYFVKGKPPEKWIKIKTSSGREQIMTPRHKFIHVDKDNNFQVKPASKIKKGDRLAILKNFKPGGDKIKTVFLPKILSKKVPLKKQEDIRIVNAEELFKKIVNIKGSKKIRSLLNISHNSLFDWYNLVPLNHVKKLVEVGLMDWKDLPRKSKLRTIFNTKEWELNLKVDKNLMSILGYYAAEGHSRQTRTVSQVFFRIMDQNQKNKLISSVKNSFDLNCSLEEEETKITICNKMIYYLFHYCLEVGKGAYEKQVPNILYNVSEELVREYLSCYFDGDGSIITSKKKVVCFYSVSKELLSGIALLCERFGIFGRFYKTKERLPGRKILERYVELGKEPKKHILHHLTYSGKDFYKLTKILKPVHIGKLEKINNTKPRITRERKIKFDDKYFNLENLGDVVVDMVKEVKTFKDEKPSYCFEIDWKSEEDKNVLWGEQIINARCDGDEAAVMLLMDVLLNFSRRFLPSHRGGTQDAPLVLNAKIQAGEVDDQILNFETCFEYPLELYHLAEEGKHSSEVKVESVGSRLKENICPFSGTGFTHDTNDFNEGVLNGAYKILPSMKEKVANQMELVEKIRAVDSDDVARLVIERHFIRDIRGNLRKFSHQQFRCVACNEKFRRPPLSGVCTKCGGKIIFTISEGSIKKYLEPALALAEKYNISTYTKEGIEMTKLYIESIFGRETEKQVELEKWF